MPVKPYFNHQTIRKAIIGLGSILDGIQIEKKDSQGNISYLTVPIKYGAKDYHITRKEEDTTFSNVATEESLPVIAYKLVSATYDTERQRNSLVNIQYPNATTNTAEKVYIPTPYELEFEVYVATDTEIQSFEIVEQIFPLFSPNYSIPVIIDKSINLVNDFVYYLTGSTFEDNYQETFDGNRIVLWTVSIACKVDFFIGKETKAKVLSATTNIFNDPTMQNVVSSQTV